MGLFVQQNSNRTKLQERLAAELTEKAKQKADTEAERPDGVDDSRYIEGTKSTTGLAWVWILVVIIAVGAAVYFMARG
ncbi:MAG: hypothetical protein WAS27_03010 [Candidatus Saccharimonadales bacterium]